MAKVEAAVQLVQWEQQKSAHARCTQWAQIPGQGTREVKGQNAVGATSSEGNSCFINIIKHKLTL